MTKIKIIDGGTGCPPAFPCKNCLVGYCYSLFSYILPKFL